MEALKWALPLILVATPAHAVVGKPLAASVAVAKAQGVTRADFVVRGGKVVFEAWRSYPGDSFMDGKPWPKAKAGKLKGALAAGRKVTVTAPRIVRWSADLVTTHYLADGSMILEPTREADGSVYILVAGTLESIDAPATRFDGSSEAYVWVNGKLSRRASIRVGY